MLGRNQILTKNRKKVLMFGLLTNKSNLLEACANGDLKCVKNILVNKRKRQLQLQLRDNHAWTPLHHAVQARSIEIVQMLISYATLDVLAETHEGCTALFLACEINAPIEIVRLLLNKNSDLVNYVNNEEVSPLQIAVQMEHLHLVQILHEYGAPINYQDLDGETALFYAVRNLNIDILQYLLYATDCDVAHTNNIGVDALIIACYSFGDEETQIKCVNELLKFSDNLNSNNLPSVLGLFNAFHAAFLPRNFTLVQFFIDKFYTNHLNNPNSIYFVENLLNRMQTNGQTNYYKMILLMHDEIQDISDITLITGIEYFTVIELHQLYALYEQDSQFFLQFFPEYLSKGISLKTLSGQLYIDFLLSFDNLLNYEILYGFIKQLSIYDFDVNSNFKDFLFHCIGKDLTMKLLTFQYIITAHLPFVASSCIYRLIPNVQKDLNSEPHKVNTLKELNSFLTDYSLTTVPKLMDICREKIRNTIFERNLHLSQKLQAKLINKLQLPNECINYLRYNHNNFIL